MTEIIDFDGEQHTCSDLFFDHDAALGVVVPLTQDWRNFHPDCIASSEALVTWYYDKLTELLPQFCTIRPRICIELLRIADACHRPYKFDKGESTKTVIANANRLFEMVEHAKF